MNKMETKQAAETRAKLYDVAEQAFNAEGMTSEIVKGGRMIDLGNGYFARVSISICAPDKVDKYRDEYAEQVAKNAERAAEREAKKAAKAAKAKPVATEKDE